MIPFRGARLAVLGVLVGLVCRSAPVVAATTSGADSASADSVLTLAWLEKMATDRNPSLAAMRQAWSEAEARADQAGALEDPMVDATVAPRSLGSSAVDPGYRIAVTQRFSVLGQRRLRRKAAMAEGEAARSELELARLDLLRDVRAGFYDYFRVGQAQETNRALLDLMRQFLRVALARYASGTVGQPDALQAETELAMLKHREVVLERERRLIVARFRALLHWPQETPLPPPPRGLAIPEPPGTAEWLAARMHGKWPELAAAEERVRARRVELSLARRERLPEFGLGVAYDRFWAEPELRPSVQLSLNLPLYSGRRAAMEREARAGLSRAEFERAAVRDRIEQRIEEASSSLEESLHDVEIMRDEVVPATEKSLKAVRAAYEANRSDFLALLNAVGDLARARLDLSEALAMAHQAHAELERALASDAVTPSGAATPIEKEQP